MSPARFDELIHAPTRLAIVSLLAACEWADFKFIRDEVGLSDSALSKQLTTLEAAGYVEIRKRFVGKRPRHLGTAELICPMAVVSRSMQPALLCKRLNNPHVGVGLGRLTAAGSGVPRRCTAVDRSEPWGRAALLESFCAEDHDVDFPVHDPARVGGFEPRIDRSGPIPDGLSLVVAGLAGDASADVTIRTRDKRPCTREASGTASPGYRGHSLVPWPVDRLAPKELR